MNDYSKIWQETKALNDDALLQYLKDNLKPEDKHALENELINSSFESDAVDGLRELPAQQIQSSVADLNNRLQKLLPAKKKVIRKKAFTMQQWIILSVVFVLVIALLAFGFIRLIHH